MRDYRRRSSSSRSFQVVRLDRVTLQVGVGLGRRDGVSSSFIGYAMRNDCTFVQGGVVGSHRGGLIESLAARSRGGCSPSSSTRLDTYSHSHDPQRSQLSVSSTSPLSSVHEACNGTNPRLLDPPPPLLHPRLARLSTLPAALIARSILAPTTPPRAGSNPGQLARRALQTCERDDEEVRRRRVDHVHARVL